MAAASPRSPVADDPQHFLDELPLGPDEHERVGADRKPEGCAGERKRRVAVAAHRFAPRCGEAPRQPELGVIEVGQHGRLRGEVHQRTRQVSRPSAEVDHAAAVDDRPGNRANQRVRDDITRVRESIQEVTALVGWSERRQRVAIGGGRRAGDRFEAGNVLAFEIQHRAAREIGTPGFDLVFRRRGRLVEVHHRDAVDHRKDAAVTRDDAVGDFIPLEAVKRRGHQLQVAAAVRTAEHLKGGGEHRGIIGS